MEYVIHFSHFTLRRKKREREYKWTLILVRLINIISHMMESVIYEMTNERGILLLLLLMIWQSPGLPGWRKVNFITVTRRPHHPNIAAGFCCLATSPGFLPTLCEKWSGFFYVHRVFLSYTRDRRLKVSSERLGKEDKAPCPRALLPGRGSNRGPPVWKSEALTARPRQLLYKCD